MAPIAPAAAPAVAPAPAPAAPAATAASGADPADPATASTRQARPRILFLDAYDSFSNNITALLATLLAADVHVLPIDAALSAAQFHAEAACYDAVVCGPGPGSPDCAADIGLMQHVWDADQDAQVPTLGICLGFQSLVRAHGGRIRRLRAGGLHGMVRAIDALASEDSANIFGGVAPFRATLYHSLGADVGQDDVPDTDWAARKWQPVADGALVPLAWVEELTSVEMDKKNEQKKTERLLMGVRHAVRPFWGLQYHPESVCTDVAGHAVLTNWFRAATAWNATHGRARTEPGDASLRARQATRPSLLSAPLVLPEPVEPVRYTARTIALPAHVEVPDIVEALHLANSATDDHDDHDYDHDHIIFDSASASLPAAAPVGVGDASDTDAIRGRYSIVALNVGAATRVEYRAGDPSATIRTGTFIKTVVLGQHTIWHLLAAFHESRRASFAFANPDALPFLGGFMGYVTYEQGLADIGVAFSRRTADRPDICWAWVTRSIVVDHHRGRVHVQSLSGADGAWAAAIVDQLQRAWQVPPVSTQSVPAVPVLAAQIPARPSYEALVSRCQEYIAAGESYELCLTGETRITTSRTTGSAWGLYRTLRTTNPSPFASFVRLGPATLVSSSPERFLCFAPGADDTLRCSMRPMKGTVRRSSTVRCVADAEAVLHVPKEEAENLMIVDLVRHDLHAVCGPGGVHVPRLLQVEPYGHVFQMVSVVEAQTVPDSTPDSKIPTPQPTGIDVLSASLPPGSMTGAPKKRSCTLLVGLETDEARAERSLYSGVVGYVCVSGRGDWSVTIRSLFRWDDESTDDADTWHVGAGGAVTILSTPSGECDEMLTKLAGPLGVFRLP